MDPRRVDPFALAAVLTGASIVLMGAGFLYSRVRRWWHECPADYFDWEGDEFE